MAGYDFLSLSPADFEELARDLLQAELGIRLESFATGRDRGIDLRCARPADSSLIVQCKHFHRSGFSQLKSHLERKELEKIKKLTPDRYVLCTSVEMTPGRKDQLLELLSPYCTDPADILGLEDLNNLLGRHPEIERQHHKLWLTSQATLQRVLHHPTFLQTEIERDSIRRRLALYVQTAAFDRAARILNDHNYCIISGIPGIGKTTLAEILIIHLIEAGFDLVVATSSLSEALQLFRPDSQQVIYYDDFLGRSSFGEKLEKNEDRTLLKLLKEVRANSSKKLILTTREYILAQARDSYELLKDAAIDLGKCIVQLDDYSRYERARILYNHLHFFGVPDDYIGALLEDKRYLRVIDHPHFSPRIVQWMTETIPVARVSAGAYAEEFLANLQNPGRLWSHAFDSDLSADARHVLLILGCMPHPCLLGALRVACAFEDGARGEGLRRFLRAVKEIDGTFVRTFRTRDDRGSFLVDFHSPSITDFVLRRLGRDQALCRELLEHATYFEQIDRLVRLKPDGTLDHSATGIVREPSVIAASINRCLRTEAAGAIRVISGGRHSWIADRTSLGRRLERASDWAVALDLGDVHRAVIDIVGSMVATGELETVYPAALSGILKAVHQSSAPIGFDDSEFIEEIIAAAVTEFEGMGAIDDWREWTSAVETVEDRVRPEQRERLRLLADAFCRAEIEQILSDSESEEQAVDWMEEVLGVAEFWHIDLSEEQASFEASLAEHFGPPPDDDREIEGWGRGERSTTDEEIDRLFDSLKERD